MSTTSIGDVSVATSCSCVARYEWDVKNFWICCLKAGDMLVSPEFIATHDSNPFMLIKLIFYPKGKTEEAKGYYFSLFAKIITRSADADIKELSLSIFNDGSELVTRLFDQPTLKDTSIWGAENFAFRHKIKRKAEENGCRSNNFAIVLKIKTWNSEKRMNVLQLRQTVGNLQCDYGKLVNNEGFSDVELVFGDKSLRAHGMILSRRCPLFAVSLMSKMREKHGTKVELENIKYEVCLEMLRYIYTEKVNNVDDIAEELLVPANEYGIRGLKLICERSLIKNVNIDNVLEKLKLAHSCDADLLKATTLGFIVAHYDEINQKPEFKKLPSQIEYLIFTANFNKLH